MLRLFSNLSPWPPSLRNPSKSPFRKGGVRGFDLSKGRGSVGKRREKARRGFSHKKCCAIL